MPLQWRSMTGQNTLLRPFLVKLACGKSLCMWWSAVGHTSECQASDMEQKLLVHICVSPSVDKVKNDSRHKFTCAG